MAASRLTSLPGLDFITQRDMTLADAAGTSAVETVAEFVIPRGMARKFVNQNGRLNLGRHDKFAGNGVLVDFTLAQAISNSPRAFPIPAVLYFQIGAGAKTFKTYTSAAAPGAGEFTVNFATNAVKTGDVAPGGTDVHVYYPPVNGDGRYTVEVFNPTERRHETYGNGTFRRINTAPQDDINSPWRMGETPWLVQDYILRIQVVTAAGTGTVAAVEVDTDNPYTLIELPYIQKPVQAVTKDELAELVAVLGQ